MARLWIVGDSFSSTVKEGIPLDPRTWMAQLASHWLMPMTNLSLRGSSQQWAWHQLATEVMPKITSLDRLIIILTHPARVWYSQKHPEITRFEHISEFKKLGLEQYWRAADLYTRVLQRQDLDIETVSHRLAWLAYQVRAKNLQPPHVLVAFEQDLGPVEFPELRISRGNMCMVSEGESADPFVLADYQKIIAEVDCRYNHMLLSNHGQLFQQLKKDQGPVDFTPAWPWVRGQFTEQHLADQQWILDEIDQQTLRERNANKYIIGRMPWNRS